MDFVDTAFIAFRPVVGLLVLGLVVTLCLRGKEPPRTAEDDEEDYWFWAIK
jgi:hypothetical protein